MTKRQVMANVRRLLHDARMGLDRALEGGVSTDRYGKDIFSEDFRCRLLITRDALKETIEQGQNEWTGV